MVMIRTRIKFCGITRLEDVQAAVECGADALGFIFYPKSKRALTLEQAAALRSAVPAFVDVTALFVNADSGYVEEVISAVCPDVLQFHGNETPDECERHGRRYTKAFQVGAPNLSDRADILTACRNYAGASGWLFDSYSAGYGGSGHGFDLSLLGAVRNAHDARPVMLAGGLNANNVGGSIRLLRPYAVDVSSGIEESPGVKSHEKMAAFAHAVRDADT